MNWEALAAIGQVLGSLGVIGSLLYLAIQVRQNNRASTVSAKLASTQLLSEFITDFIRDPEMMDLWLRGRQGDDKLTDRDRLRFANMCLKAFWFFSAAEFQLRMRTLQEDDWAEFYAVIRYWLEGVGVRAWWTRVGRSRFGRDFVRFVDGEIRNHRTTGLREFAERYTAAWCSGNPRAVAAFFAENGSLTINDGDPARGRQAIADAAQSFMVAFPDLKVAMDDLVERDGKAIYKWTLTGTNTGPGGSGNLVRISGYEEWQLGDDGLIAGSQGHFDAEEYERQIEGGSA
ncbi:MAG: ester cyclase [Candidatus Baltobacteraceae bacterium]